jgi:hypothetical protein
VVTRNITQLLSVAGALGLLAVTPVRALAHCDGLDGPVVKAAERALETRNPAFALIWVQEKDEREIQTAFDQALAVRELSPQAKELADRFFFETLVRLHRAGEGAAFTGLQPAGRDIGTAIPVADEAIRAGSVEPVRRLLMGVLDERLREQFGAAMSAKTFKSTDLPAGRAYVRAYVEFIHFVERLYDITTNAPHGHFDESDVPAKVP